ncbi:whey acidic protein-like [Vipera latastei]
MAAGFDRDGPARFGPCPPPAAFPDEACGHFCSSDESCPGAQRCCRTGCGRQCHRPLGEPEAAAQPLPTGLGLRGFTRGVGTPSSPSPHPAAIRGYCPRRSPSGRHPLFCRSGCRRDSSCALSFPGRKCCRYGCRESCVPPVEEHPGDCPKMPVLQTLVACNHTCTDDRQCPPEEKCCYDGCGLACLPPEPIFD